MLWNAQDVIVWNLSSEKACIFLHIQEIFQFFM